MKINVKWFLYLPILFFFLPAFVFWVPFLKTTCQIFYISIYICLAILFFLQPKNFINKFIKLYKIKYFRLLVWLIIAIIINSLFLSFMGVGLLSHSFKAIITQLFLLVIPILLYFIYIIDKYISFKNFIKFYTILLWGMFIMGFISYIGAYFDIQFILSFFEFLANDRLIYTQNIGMNMQASNYFAYGLPRLSCVFDEPGHYAQFIFLNLPLILCISGTKLKIIKHKYLNFIIKKTLIPFALFSIILTMSPIFLIFTIIFLLIFYFEKIKKNIVKIMIGMSLFVFALIVFLSNIEIENTYLYRIIKIISSVKCYEDFNVIEPSLATRIGTYINSICVFLQNPLLGVGYGNLAHKLIWQYDHSPVPLTPEVIEKTALLAATKNIAFCGKGIYTFIAENGILICSLAFLSLKIIFDKIKFNIKISYMYNIWTNIIVKILFFEFIVFTICAFYNLSFVSKDLWFFIALTIVLVSKKNFIYYQNKEDNK